jgi:hypothetical protein
MFRGLPVMERLDPCCLTTVRGRPISIVIVIDTLLPSSVLFQKPQFHGPVPTKLGFPRQGRLPQPTGNSLPAIRVPGSNFMVET